MGLQYAKDHVDKADDMDEDTVDRAAVSEGEDVVEGPRPKKVTVKKEKSELEQEVHSTRANDECDCPHGLHTDRSLLDYHQMMNDALANWKKAVKRKQKKDAARVEKKA